MAGFNGEAGNPRIPQVDRGAFVSSGGRIRASPQDPLKHALRDAIHCAPRLLSSLACRREAEHARLVLDELSGPLQAHAQQLRQFVYCVMLLDHAFAPVICRRRSQMLPHPRGVFRVLDETDPPIHQWTQRHAPRFPRSIPNRRCRDLSVLPDRVFPPDALKRHSGLGASGEIAPKERTSFLHRRPMASGCSIGRTIAHRLRAPHRKPAVALREITAIGAGALLAGITEQAR
jgi:hypothetical protein